MLSTEKLAMALFGYAIPLSFYSSPMHSKTTFMRKVDERARNGRRLFDPNLHGPSSAKDMHTPETFTCSPRANFGHF
jgi:hypothetical protein